MTASPTPGPERPTRGFPRAGPSTLEPPEELRERLAGWDRELAWQIVPEVATWRLSGADGRVRFLKSRTPTTTPDSTRRSGGCAGRPTPSRFRA